MKKIIISLMILAVITTSMCIGQEKTSNGTYEAYYYGTEFLFNSNLDIAQNITVIPNENVLKNTIFGYNVVSLNFVYYDKPEETPLYTKAIVSFVSKYQKVPQR